MSQEMVWTPAAALAEKKDWATAMANANLLPPAYQRQPANLLLAAEYADTLGVPRMTALTGIHVIKGKPSISADLMASLVRRAGHKLRVSGNDHTATAVLIRADDPEYKYEATWTMDRAKRAGLVDKKDSTWRTYPEALLRARAITEVCRMGASEVLFGAIYTPEELGAVVSEDGAPTGDLLEDPDVANPEAVEEAAPVGEGTWLRVLELADALSLDDAVLTKTARFCGHAGDTLEGVTQTVAEEMISYMAGRLRDVIAEEQTPGEDIVDAEIIEDEQPTLDGGEQS